MFCHDSGYGLLPYGVMPYKVHASYEGRPMTATVKTMRRILCESVVVEIHSRGRNLDVWLADVNQPAHLGRWSTWFSADSEGVALAACAGDLPLPFLADWVDDQGENPELRISDDVARLTTVLRDPEVRDCDCPF